MTTLAQSLVARSMAAHPQKSGRVWELITTTGAVTAATVTTQGKTSISRTVIHPMEEEVGEREAEYIGHNVLAGDLKLKLPGTLELSEQSELMCDGQSVDIKRLDRFYHNNQVQQYRLYVALRHEQ